ncbi:hypothetical protein HYV73_01100 [Candidatus Uhrbacteria bacterium]|nr:hypothetical protein [Candidatus Uhrbacteria bacterium]
MQSLQEVYTQLEACRKEKKELMKMIKDELSQHDKHRELSETMKTMKMEKKAIEDTVLVKSQGSGERMKEIAAEMAAYQELMSDIALNMYVKNETVELMDAYEQKYEPVFVVKFKKAG